jgi:hypothetical protein
MQARKPRYPESFPHAEIVTFEFPERRSMPPLRLFWYDGGLLPPRPQGLELVERAPSMYYVGEKGVLIPRPPRRPATTAATGDADAPPPAAEFILLVDGKRKEFAPPRKTIPRSIGHYREWIEASKGGKPSNCNFEYARLFAETALLGVIAARMSKDLEYDAHEMRFLNEPDANQFLRCEYRTGWSL